MTYELDIVGEDIIPYLVHFSEIGIIPEIVDADNISIRTVRLKGPRLNDFLKAESNAVQLSKVYERIGFQVGHISNHGVIHGDLRTDNIIVENNVPFLIDWGSTKIMPIAFKTVEDAYQFWLKYDSEHLLKDTAKILKEKNSDAYPKLESAYLVNFRKELASPLDVSYRDMEHRVYELYGVI